MQVVLQVPVAVLMKRVMNVFCSGSDTTEVINASSTDCYALVPATTVPDEVCDQSPALPLYKIVGDNVDRNIVARYMRTNHKVKSLHYYHSFAVRDRISVVDLSAEKPSLCLPSPDVVACSLLPQSVDDDTLYENIKILFSQVLVETLFCLETTFSDLIIRHIHHRQYSEMSSKSIIVCTTCNLHALYVY